MALARCDWAVAERAGLRAESVPAGFGSGSELVCLDRPLAASSSPSKSSLEHTAGQLVTFP